MSDSPSPYGGESGAAAAEAAVAFLRAQKLTASPRNFEVWTTHLLGVEPALCQAVQSHLNARNVLTDAFMEELHGRFFTGPPIAALVFDTSEALAKELAVTIQTLRGAGAQSAAFDTALNSAQTALDAGVDATALKAIATGLSEATRSITAQNRNLMAQMELSSQQIDTLQTALKDTRAEAYTDALTGLANRRKFDLALHRAMASPASPCLIIGDIDHFKRINDGWGHAIGDQVIRFVARIMQDRAPPDATAARYGGEEFALILPRDDLELARELACLIQNQVRSQRITKKATGETIGPVTLSLGIARYRPGESASDLIERADMCLYQSKRDGRDRVTLEADLFRRSA